MSRQISQLKNYFKNAYFPIITLFFIIGLLILYFFLTIPPKDYREDSAVQIHFAENISDSHRKVIDKFNEKYKGKIKIIPINLPFEKFSTNERKELLARTLRSKSSRLDVFTVDQIWVPRFAKWAARLDQYFIGTAREAIVPYALNTCVYQNKLYAVPLYMDIGLMYFNSEIIEKEFGSDAVDKIVNGIYWDDFIQMNIKLKQKGYVPYLFPADGYEGLMCSFTEIYYGLANKDFSRIGFDIDSDTFRKSSEFLYDLINRYSITPEVVTNFKETESYNYFFENNAVFLRGWPGLDHSINELRIKDNKKLSILTAPLPKFRNSKLGSVFGGWNLMISKYSQHKKESLIFINYLMTQESQSILYNDGGHLPVLKSMYEKDDAYDLKYYYGLFSNGIYRPISENYTKFSDIIAVYLNLALRGELNVNDAIRKARTLLNKNKLILK